MMSTTGRAQMVAVRYTRARTRRINSLTHTHARTKRHTDTTAAARQRRRRKQRTQHVTTTYERSPRLRLYESLSASLTHSLREATHCWAETRRTASTSCPLSRKAAVTLKRGPRCYGEGATGSTYEHTMWYERARNRVRMFRIRRILYIYMYTPPPLGRCRTLCSRRRTTTCPCHRRRINYPTIYVYTRVYIYYNVYGAYIYI